MEAYLYWFVIIWVGAMALIIERMQRLKHPLLEDDRQERVQLIGSHADHIACDCFGGVSRQYRRHGNLQRDVSQYPRQFAGPHFLLKRSGEGQGLFCLVGAVEAVCRKQCTWFTF